MSFTLAIHLRPGRGVCSLLLACLLNLAASGIAGAATASPEGTDITLVTAHLLPFSIQEGRQQGFMVELVREIERRLGTNRPVRFLPWPRAYRDALLSPNHVVFPLARIPEREADFDWAIRVAPLTPVFVTLNGKRLTLQTARQQGAIAVQQNSPFEQYLRERGFTNLVITTSAAPIPIRMLRAGRVDAWFTARDLASYSMREQFVTEPITYSDPVFSVDIYIALSREFPAQLKQAYLDTFEQIKNDGTFARIMGDYLKSTP